MNTKISAVIITKNAERRLKEVLEKIKNIVDEIIIVDSGSSDSTLEIAKTSNAIIFDRAMTGFGEQKNFGIHKAKNLWILSLDADEMINEELYQSIEKADFDKFDGYYLNRRNLFAGKWVRHSGWYPDWHLRLFRKDKMEFENVEVHELVRPNGNVGYLKGDIIHESYLSNQHFFEKTEVYTTKHAKDLYNKKRKWNLFYQIGKPLKEFFQIYFLKKGFLDGFLGLKLAFYYAYYRWVVAKKLRLLYKQENTL